MCLRGMFVESFVVILRHYITLYKPHHIHHCHTTSCWHLFTDCRMHATCKFDFKSMPISVHYENLLSKWFHCIYIRLLSNLQYCFLLFKATSTYDYINILIATGNSITVIGKILLPQLIIIS